MEQDVVRAVRALDVPAVRERYRLQNEFVYLERWLPASLIGRFVEEVDQIGRAHV